MPFNLVSIVSDNNDYIIHGTNVDEKSLLHLTQDQFNCFFEYEYYEITKYKFIYNFTKNDAFKIFKATNYVCSNLKEVFVPILVKSNLYIAFSSGNLDNNDNNYEKKLIEFDDFYYEYLENISSKDTDVILCGLILNIKIPTIESHSFTLTNDYRQIVFNSGHWSLENK